jgi:hypothetical protein
MAAIDAVIFAAAAGFAFVIVVTIVVIVGIHQEERYLTLTNKRAPSAAAQLARIVLGRYVRKEQEWAAEHPHPLDDADPREPTTISMR